MPLLLYLPADHPVSARPVRRAQLWLEAQCHQWHRAPRFLADRRHLIELDARLLSDVGLTREDVARGVPFRPDAEDAAKR